MYAQRERSQDIYPKAQEAQYRTFLGWLELLVKIAIGGYLVAQRQEVFAIIGLQPDTVMMLLLFAILLLIGETIGVDLSARACYRHTGLRKNDDRNAFTLTGGFDAGRIPLLVVNLATYGIYAWTFRLASDPLGFARQWWIFMLSTTVVGLILTIFVTNLVFRRYAARNPQAMYNNAVGRAMS